MNFRFREDIDQLWKNRFEIEKEEIKYFTSKYFSFDGPPYPLEPSHEGGIHGINEFRKQEFHDGVHPPFVLISEGNRPLDLSSRRRLILESQKLHRVNARWPY